MTSAAMPNSAATAKVTSSPCTMEVGTPAPACSCAWPAAALSTVTSTASPSAAPTCWVTLTRPDAAPASAGSTPASPACVSGTSAVPEPTPSRTRLTKICPYDAPACSWLDMKRATTVRLMPPMISALGWTRLMRTLLTSCDDRNTEAGTGRKHSPVRSGENPCTSCMNCPTKKNMPYMPAYIRPRDTLAVVRVPLAKSRSGTIGSSARVSMRTNTPSRKARRRASRR